jgi:hypothetical protein
LIEVCFNTVVTKFYDDATSFWRHDIQHNDTRPKWKTIHARSIENVVMLSGLILSFVILSATMLNFNLSVINCYADCRDSEYYFA